MLCLLCDCLFVCFASILRAEYNQTMGDADDFSRDPLTVTPTMNKPTSEAAKNAVADFHKKVVHYDAKNFPANNQNTFCW